MSANENNSKEKKEEDSCLKEDSVSNSSCVEENGYTHCCNFSNYSRKRKRSQFPSSEPCKYQWALHMDVHSCRNRGGRGEGFGCWSPSKFHLIMIFMCIIQKIIKHRCTLYMLTSSNIHVMYLNALPTQTAPYIYDMHSQTGLYIDQHPAFTCWYQRTGCDTFHE